MTTSIDAHANVKEYYSETLSTMNDFATNACSLAKGGIPKYMKDAMSSIHKDVSAK